LKFDQYALFCPLHLIGGLNSNPPYFPLRSSLTRVTSGESTLPPPSDPRGPAWFSPYHWSRPLLSTRRSFIDVLRPWGPPQVAFPASSRYFFKLLGNPNFLRTAVCALIPCFTVSDIGDFFPLVELYFQFQLGCFLFPPMINVPRITPLFGASDPLRFSLFHLMLVFG